MTEGKEAAVPLLPSRGGTDVGTPTIVIDGQEEEDPDLEEATEEDKALFADHKRRGTSLIWNDAILLLLHILQVFSVLQSLALRWPFPVEWVWATRFMFLFNLDVWDFAKVQTNGTFKEVQNYYTPSTAMPFSYWHLMLAWAIFVCVAVTAFIIAYLVITYRKHPFMMIKLANLQRVYIVGVQVVCIPLAMVIARVFHCTDTSVMEVDNTVPCYADGLHWAYICPSAVTALFFYCLLPAWMIVRTRAELLNLNADRHEGYLQLKEVEYVQGLDVLYIVGRFHIFASFRKYGAHMRAQLFILTLCLALVVAFTFNHIFIGGLILTLIFLLLLIISLVIRPFRVTCFNLELSFSYLCLLVFSLLGTMRASFNSFSLASAWLTPSYLNVLLPMIVFIWLGVTVAFVVYLIIRQVGCCLRLCPNPLWPSMTSDDLNKLSPETRKYVRTIVRCRALVERSLAMPPMFAPAHELARQIHVMNAFCREAEHLADPIHDTLWDVLDELLEAHAQIAPRSLFAESVKDSIRQTASELMKLMPNMKRRLAQREYDFILMSPVKRRLLFKMYIMGIFLNGRREKIEKEKLTLPGVQKVYQSHRYDDDYEPDDGYYEDMYPEAEEKPLQRPETALSLGLFSDAGLDDELALEEAEEWTRHHPLSAGIANQGFEDDVSAILRDDLSDSVSAMMDGVPTGSRSLSRLSTAGSARHLYNRLVVVDRPGSGRTNSRLTVTATATSQNSIDRISSTTPPDATQRLPMSPLAAAELQPSGSRPMSAGSPRPGSAVGRGTSPQGSRPGSAHGSTQETTQHLPMSPRATTELQPSGSREMSAGSPRPGSAAGRVTSPQGSRPNSAHGSIQEATQHLPMSPLATTELQPSGSRPTSAGSLRPGSEAGRVTSPQGSRPSSAHGSIQEATQHLPMSPLATTELQPSGSRPTSAGSLRPGSAAARVTSPQGSRPDSAHGSIQEVTQHLPMATLATTELQPSGSRPTSAGSLRPVSEAERVTSPQGSRPDSAHGSIQAEEEWRQSPLPGQIHVQPAAEGGQDASSSGAVHSLSPGASGQSDA